MWLKIKIPSAFLGSDVVDWLYEKVDGFDDRREARKFACQLLKSGLVKHTVNKTTFSEQCYYAFGDEATLSSCKSTGGCGYCIVDVFKWCVHAYCSS